MRFKEIEYSKTFNLGNYESERISVRVELDEMDNLDTCFQIAKGKVHQFKKDISTENPTNISESLFSGLPWRPETGKTLANYEISLVQDCDPEQWRNAYDFLLEKKATISSRHPEESYTYWLYDKMDYKIFRQKLRDSQQ